MSKHVINVGLHTTYLDDGSGGLTASTTEVVAALVRLLGVDVVLAEILHRGP
jgi:hypothetical protein